MKTIEKWRLVRDISIDVVVLKDGKNPQTGGPIVLYHRMTLVLNDEESVTMAVWDAGAFGISLYNGTKTYHVLCLHDLFKFLHDFSGGSLVVHRAEIYEKDLDDEGPYYQARLIISNNDGGEEEIACPPSDAVNIAFRFDAPIFVSDELLKTNQENVEQALLESLSDDDVTQ